LSHPSHPDLSPDERTLLEAFREQKERRGALPLYGWVVAKIHNGKVQGKAEILEYGPPPERRIDIPARMW